MKLWDNELIREDKLLIGLQKVYTVVASSTEALGQYAHQRGQVTGSVYKSCLVASSTWSSGTICSSERTGNWVGLQKLIVASSTEALGQCAHQRGQVTGSVYKSCLVASSMWSSGTMCSSERTGNWVGLHKLYSGQFYVKLWDNVLIREDR